MIIHWLWRVDWMLDWRKLKELTGISWRNKLRERVGRGLIGPCEKMGNVPLLGRPVLLIDLPGEDVYRLTPNLAQVWSNGPYLWHRLLAADRLSFRISINEAGRWLLMALCWPSKYLLIGTRLRPSSSSSSLLIETFRWCRCYQIWGSLIIAGHQIRAADRPFIITIIYRLIKCWLIDFGHSLETFEMCYPILAVLPVLAVGPRRRRCRGVAFGTGALSSGPRFPVSGGRGLGAHHVTLLLAALGRVVGRWFVVRTPPDAVGVQLVGQNVEFAPN